ncbi:MAG: multicopper oxidase family protein [Candidatus Altimarinota bacterium]|jgi:FtsP/CotA-like multicopper oxidase with cupredoxin domain
MRKTFLSSITVILFVLIAAAVIGCSNSSVSNIYNKDEPRNHSMMNDNMGGMNGNMGMMDSKKNPYSQVTTNLPLAKKSQVVELNNGDNYQMTAQIVAKEINGKKVKMLAYNGMIPGPLLKVARGSTITINFTNETDEEAMLHSHGVRLKNAFDGTNLTQKPIPIGGSFTYEVTFPDTGIYWYHPHLREDYTQELGLYGNYLVQSEDPDYWSPVNRELPLVIDDLILENGQIAPFYKDQADHALMGRYGNTVLVNGETEYQLELTKGEVIRWYVTNVSNARPYQFTIPGIRMKFVGGDASKMEQETFVESVIIAPSERAVLEVFFPEAGEYQLLNKNPESTMKLGTIIVSDGQPDISYADQFNTSRTNKDVIAEIDPFRKYFDRPIDKSLEMTLQMGMMNGNMGMMMENESHKIEWEDEMGHMNANSTPDMITWKLVDQATGKSNMDIDWTFKKGEVVKIRLFNNPDSNHPMQHPIHLHGQRFLVLETNGERNKNLVWKDTALIQTGDTVDILVDMSNPGKWMIHCHIAEHLEADMMLGFEVLP